jgi:hypothetical protein
MIDPELFRLLEDAIAKPKDYSSGNGKDRLRAAFDAVTSQIFAGIFGHEPPSRANARLALNSARKADFSGEIWSVVGCLSFAINEADASLHRKDYSEHESLIEKFVINALRPLVELFK